MSKGDLVAIPKGEVGEMSGVTAVQEVRIKANGHPHFGETGLLTDRSINSTGQLIVELDDCKHGVDECAVMPDEIKSVYRPSEATSYDIKGAEKPRDVGGRPSKYTPELGDYICEQITEGRSLRSICKEEGMPSIMTIFNWHRSVDGFLEQYTRAKDEQADTNAEELQDISAKVLRGEYDPASARVAADILKWTSAKLKPKKYGDKIDLSTNGKDLPTPILGSIVINNETGVQTKGLLEDLDS